MHGVSPFEAELLRLLSCLLGRTPAEHLVGLVAGQAERPEGLSRAGVDLVIDHCRKGLASHLARSGGWQSARFLREGRIVQGKLWERHEPRTLELRFTGHALEFLIWLRTADPATNLFVPRADLPALSTGDRLLMHLAYSAFRETELASAFLRQPVLNGNALTRLKYPEDFLDRQGLTAPDWSLVIRPEEAWIVEALQPLLRERWRTVERHKSIIIQPAEMISLGASQDEILDGFLSAIERSRRRDLARFLLQTLADVLQGAPNASEWVRSLNLSELRAADRAAAYEASLSLLRRAQLFRRWTESARGVSYLDREDYAASQLWLSDWEAWNGEAIVRTAAELNRQLDPLRLS